MINLSSSSFFFFFNDTATTEIYTLSLTTLFRSLKRKKRGFAVNVVDDWFRGAASKKMKEILLDTESQIYNYLDRKSTRLNSSHLVISYAVFCLKKKKKNTHNR